MCITELNTHLDTRVHYTSLLRITQVAVNNIIESIVPVFKVSSQFLHWHVCSKSFCELKPDHLQSFSSNMHLQMTWTNLSIFLATANVGGWDILILPLSQPKRDVSFLHRYWKNNTPSVPTKLNRPPFLVAPTKLSHFLFWQKTIHPIPLTLFHHILYSLFIFVIVFLSPTFQHIFIISVSKNFDSP